jgi:hypothetical protein
MRDQGVYSGKGSGLMVGLLMVVGLAFASAQSTFCGSTNCGFVPAACCTDVYTNDDVWQCCTSSNDCCSSTGQCESCGWDDNAAKNFATASIAIIIGGVVGSVCFLCIIGGIVWYYFYRRNQITREMDKALLNSANGNVIVVGANNGSQPQSVASYQTYPQYQQYQQQQQQYAPYPQHSQYPAQTRQQEPYGYVPPGYSTAEAQAQVVQGFPAPTGPVVVQGTASAPAMPGHVADAAASKSQNY